MSVRLYVEHQVAFIEINYPPLNILSQQMIEELNQILDDIEECNNIHVLVLKSAHKIFSAGADLKELSQLTKYDDTEDPMKKWQRLSSFSKPVIGFVQGACFGGGLELAMMCDFIFASETAKFSFPEINLNLMPGGGGTVYAHKFFKSSQISYLMMSGQIIDALKAKEWGLVIDVFCENEAHLRVQEISQNIALKSLYALKSIKSTLSTSNTHDLEKERREFYQLLLSLEGKQGVRNFLNKKK